MNSIRFGINIDPSSEQAQDAFQLARLADDLRLDLITIQDHPYNRRFLDTWTLLTALATHTQQVHVATNVANLPLRPPVMLANMAASLVVLTGGRGELGLGAGVFWQGVEAYGGEARTPGEAYSAFEEALHILRGFWDHAGGTFDYEGTIYQVKGARPGPAPAHRIPIWTGAIGPRMLRLTGRMADGVLVSRPYVPPGKLPALNAAIDDGAVRAGRDPSEIRRGYNLMGAIRPVVASTKDEMIGPVAYWVDELARLHQEYRVDTFLFWPVGGREREQIEVFAQEIIPAIRQAVR